MILLLLPILHVHMVVVLFSVGHAHYCKDPHTTASTSNSTLDCNKNKGQDLQALQEGQQVLYQALDLYLALCLQGGRSCKTNMRCRKNM